VAGGAAGNARQYTGTFENAPESPSARSGSGQLSRWRMADTRQSAAVDMAVCSSRQHNSHQ